MSSVTSPSLEDVSVAAPAVADQQDASAAHRRKLTELEARCEMQSEEFTELRTRYDMQSQKLSVAWTTIDGLVARLAAANEQCAAQAAKIGELERSLESKRSSSDPVALRSVSPATEQQIEELTCEKAGSAGTKRSFAESRGTSSPLPRPVKKQVLDLGTTPVETYATASTQRVPPAPRPIPLNIWRLSPREMAVHLREEAARRKPLTREEVMEAMRQAQEEREAKEKQAADKVGPKPTQNAQSSGNARPKNWNYVGE